MALKLTQNSTGKSWSSGSKKEEEKKTTGATAPVVEKHSSPSGKLTLTRTSTSTSIPAEEPGLLERIGKTLSGTGRRQVSGYAGAAENLLENTKRLDMLNSSQNRKAQQEQENAANYRKMLERGTMDDGSVIDAEKRAWLENALKRAEQRAGVYQQSNEAIHQPITGLIDKTDAYGDRVGAAAEADLQRAKQGAGVIGSTLVDAGSALTDVLADAAANMILPGLGTAGRAARSYGHGAEAAEDKGLGLAQQNLYGAGSAALGELANRMFSSNPILQKAFGKGALDDILLPGLEKSLPGSIVKSGFGEAIEEGGENIADYFLQRAIMGDQADDFSWKDVGYDALIGGLVGGVTGVSRGRGSQNVQNQETDSPASQNPATAAAPARSLPPTEGNSMGQAENAAEGLKMASTAIEAKQQPLPSPTDRRASVMETAKKTLGKEGYRMFEAAYRDSDDPATSYSELTRAYNEGLAGRKTGSRTLTAGQYESMFEAGRADAAANVAKQQALAAKETTFSRKDSGIDYSDTVTGEYVKGVDQKTVKTIDNVAKALGVKVRFADSVEGGSANAQIQNGVITIEKGNPHPLRSLFGHEITHRMQDLAPAEYAKLRETVAKSGWTNAAIQKEQARYAQHGRTIGNEAALDEAVADYVGALMEDEGELERFIQKHSHERTLLEKLRDIVRELKVKLRGTEHEKQLLAVEKRLGQTLDAAVKQAKTNVNADVGVDVDAKTESAAPTFSLKTWNESEYVTARNAAAKDLAAALGISQKKAKAYIDSVNSIAKMIADDQARLDYEASPGRSSFVSNSEYGGSFDFSTLCKKRRLLTGTFTAIQKALPNTALTADEILEIRNMMAEQGLEVSCGLCYVEGSRANMGGFTQQFIELYKKYNPGKWYPDMAEMNTPDGIEWVRINHPEVYEQYEYFWNHHGQLRDGDPNLFASQQKPKLYQLHTEYKGEILKHFSKGDSVEQKNENGGVRLQSFSDFEIVHLLDTMQVITDMARVGLAGQAYTKVPDFAWALGDTGLKINLSLIAKGVDEDGKLIFDEREGMPIADAMTLRDRYSKNVGTIIVAFNDAQLKAAMADDRIDFIIPFHRSQWKKSQYKAMGLPAKTKDYTNQQNEKLIQKTYHEYRGRMVPDKATNYMPNAYWDFSKTGKENAEAYLKMCAANNKRPKFYKFLKNNGDGSYSLQPDGSTDGYWKLLIDFKMYDNDGKGAPQNPVRPDFNMEECQRMLDEYAGGHANFPVAHGIVDEFVDKYKREHPGKRFSLKDSDYMAAVERGDTETAQQMVSEAAKAAGYTEEVFHGMGHRHNTYKSGSGQYGDGVYFTYDKGIGRSYGGVVDHLYVKVGKIADYGDAYKALGKRDDQTEDEFAQALGFPSFDDMINDWDNDPTDVASNPELIDLLMNKGFEGFVDDGNAGFVLWDFDGIAYRIKLADPVTYDDSGNVIPLSQRFNPDNPDIRYSAKDSESLAREIARIQKEGRAQKRSDADVQADIRKAVEEAYTGMVDEYGAINPGERAARDVQVPKKTGKDKKVSQTVRTAMEAAATPDEALPDIQKLIATGEFSYDVYTDKAAIADAASTIESAGWAQSLADWTDQVKRGIVSKANTAMGWALYNNAVNSGDTKTALTVLENMVQHQRNAAQALQATRILKKLSPETQLYQIQRSVENLQQELNERYGDKKAPKIVIDQTLAEEYRSAQTQEERDEVMKEIYRDVGRQMPPRFIDKWNAWRYLAMLGNARTHVRNVVGNAGFAPIVATKNLTATAIEAAVSRVSGGKLNRSKSVVGFSKADRALLSAAWADFAKVQDQIMGNGKYSDSANPNQYIEDGRQIFKFKPLEAARRGNTKMLEKEDMWFSRPHYAAALASYCKQHGLTPEQIARGKETTAARTYAIREAQKATYRDTNALSQTISELGRPRADETNPVKKGVGVVMEGILPFRKTPANILARGLEYSPMGLLNGIKQAVWDVKRGKKTGAEAIDSIASGLTGTGLLAAGMYLAAQGLIRGHGGGDEEEKEFEELMGHQAYALEIGDKSYTLDWLAPEALPFFVGVNLWEQTKGSDEEVTLSAMLNAVKTVTEPLLEMSCLQSLNDVFDSVGYATSDGLDGLPAALASAATSYLTQALPTLLGQAERTGEDVRMTTYTEKNDFLTSDLQYTLGKASARIPGPEYQQIPYIDAWGRTESSGAVGERAVNNFLNPAYTSEIQTSAMEEELLRLYEQTGEGKILPSRAAKYFNVGGDRKDLTAEEYVKYAQKKGQTSYSLLTGLTKSSTYKGMESSDQVDAISKCYEYANAVAKSSVSDFKPDGWVAKAISASSTTGIKAEQYVTLYIQQGKISSLKNAKGETIDNSKGLQVMQMIYNTPGLTEKQREQLFLDFSVGKTIRHYNKALVDQKLKVMESMAK